MALLELAAKRLDADTEWGVYGCAAEGSIRCVTDGPFWATAERVSVMIEEGGVRVESRSFGLRTLFRGTHRRNLQVALRALVESLGEMVTDARSSAAAR